VNDIVSYGGQLPILIALWDRDALTGPNALYAIAATSAVGAALGAFHLRASLAWVLDSATISLNWRFGKWLVGGTIGFWAATHLYGYLAAAIVGLFAAGVLKAAQTLLGPLNVILLSLAAVLPTRFAHAYGAGGDSALRHALRTSYMTTLPVIAAYCGLTSVFGGQLLDLVYGSSYAPYGSVVALFSLFYFVSYLGQLLGAALSARGSTRPLFVGNVVGAAVGVGIGWVSIVALGIDGAVVGMIVSIVALNLVLWRAYRTKPRGAAAFPLSAYPEPETVLPPRSDTSSSNAVRDRDEHKGKKDEMDDSRIKEISSPDLGEAVSDDR
jgi:O-antigen/teichoic acid export membrane protein